MRRLITIDQLTDRYPFIPEATWRYWRHKGTGPTSVKLGRRIVYDEADVEAWIEQHFAEATNPGPAA